MEYPKTIQFKWLFIALSGFAGIIAPPLFIGTFTIAGLLRPGYSAMSQAASDLGRGANGWIFNWDLRLLGLLMICFALGFFFLLRSLLSRSKAITVLLLLCISGLGAIGGGVFMEVDPQHIAMTATSGLLHGASFITLFLAFVIALFLMGFSFLRVSEMRKYGMYTVITALVTLLLNIVSVFIPASLQIGGLMQRIMETESFAWYVVMGVLLVSFAYTHQRSLASKTIPFL